MGKAKLITAIDVGSSKITTIIGSVIEDSDKVNIIGAQSIPSAGVKKGQIIDIDKASDAIVKSVESAERMAGCSIGRTAVSVGGAHIASQNSHGVVAVSQQNGEISEEDVKRVLEAARAVSLPSNREILHVLPRTYTVDSQEGIVDPVSMSGIRLEVETHIVTGSTTAIKNLAKCVNEVGADINNFVYSGIASAEAVLSETEKDLGVILVDIGGGTTSIVVFVDGSPAYSTVFPVGAINITKDLVAGLRLNSTDDAEKVKIALSKELKKNQFKSEDAIKTKEEKEEDFDLSGLGIEGETKKISRKTLIEGIIKPRLTEIFDMVAIDIQKNGLVGLTPSGIVLTGGGALTIGAVDICKKNLGMSVRIGYPGKIVGLIDEISDPSYSTAVGLLLGMVKKEMGGSSYRKESFSKKENGQKNFEGGFFGKIKTIIKKFLPL